MMKAFMSTTRCAAIVSVVLAATSLLAAAPAHAAPAGQGSDAERAAASELIPATIKAGMDLRVAHRRYALCSATDVTPGSKQTVINGRRYTVGTGVCPIVTGWTVYNKSLQGNATTAKGAETIWSSYGVPPQFPQFINGNWTIAPDVLRRQTVEGPSAAGTGANPVDGGMANFFGFPCVVIDPVSIDGRDYPMAMCAGPLMENVDNRPVSPGSPMRTHAPEGARFPVGSAEVAGSARLDGLIDLLLGRVTGQP